MALFKITGKMEFGSGNNATIHIIAVSRDAAVRTGEERGFYFAVGTMVVEELEAKGITPAQMSAFVTKYATDKALKLQRFGQAFLNEFTSVNPLVEAHHYGGYLWEEKNTNIAIDKINELGLIDWTN